MVRSYLLTLKIINLGVFAWILIIFLFSIFDFDAVVTTADDEFVILAFFRALRNVFSYMIYGGGLAIAFGCSILIVGESGRYMFNFIQAFFERYLSNWFSIGTPELKDIPDLMLSELEVLFNDFYSIYEL